jgi:hypothetical protein
MVTRHLGLQRLFLECDQPNEPVRVHLVATLAALGRQDERPRGFTRGICGRPAKKYASPKCVTSSDGRRVDPCAPPGPPRAAAGAVRVRTAI